MENENQGAQVNVDGYRISIEEMQYLLEQQYKGMEAIKATARQLLASGSLIVALIGALQVFGATVPADRLGVYNGILGLAVVLYIILIGCCVAALSLQEMYTPVRADWDVLQECFIVSDDEEDILGKRLVAYLNVIKKNRPILAWRTRATNIAAILLPVIVLALFALNFVRYW